MKLSKKDIAEIIETSYEDADLEFAGELLALLLRFSSHGDALKYADARITHIEDRNKHVLFLTVEHEWNDTLPDYVELADDLKEWKFSDGVRLFDYVNIKVCVSVHREA